MAMMFMYDYLLTLPDEVQAFAVSDADDLLNFSTQQVVFVWKGGKTWSECPNLLMGHCEDLMAATLSVLYLSHCQRLTRLARPG